MTNKIISQRLNSSFKIIENRIESQETRNCDLVFLCKAVFLKETRKPVTTPRTMAIMLASELYIKVAKDAVQIHGDYGYIKDYPVEKFYRDSKLCAIDEGTTEIQKVVIAKNLLKG